jgi:hypothetical protein
MTTKLYIAQIEAHIKINQYGIVHPIVKLTELYLGYRLFKDMTVFFQMNECISVSVQAVLEISEHLITVLHLCLRLLNSPLKAMTIKTE